MDPKTAARGGGGGGAPLSSRGGGGGTRGLGLTDSIDTMLDDFMQVFQHHTPADNHTHRSTGQGPDECLVCYDTKSETDAEHGLFRRCGHGAMLCNNCADRVHRCPLCREIKEGWESFVMATEALQGGRPCDEQFGDSRETSFFLPSHTDDDDGVSCSAAPAPTTTSVPSLDHQLDAELDAFLGAVTPADGPLAGTAPPAPTQQYDDNHHHQQNAVNQQHADPNEPVAMDEEPRSVVSAAPEGRPRRKGAGTRRETTSPSPAPSATHSPSRRRRRIDEAQLAAQPEPEQQQEEPAPHQRSDAVSDDPDNPFAKYKVRDDDVEFTQFKQFQALMMQHNFTSKELAAGKRFRKRLKNRRQVMMYADKQRVNTASLKSQNTELVRQMQNLQGENTDLKSRNHYLEQTLEYLEQARTDAVNECSSLQDQMLRLTSQMNELGFFDDHMVSLE